MFSVKALASLTFILSPAVAAVEKRFTLDISTTTGAIGNAIMNCPAGWQSYNRLQQSYCCPGQVETNGNILNLDDSYCCVHAPTAPSFSSCFPFCTTTGTGIMMASMTPQCSTTVMLTDADYSSKVSAAATSIGFTSGGVFMSSSGSGASRPQETGSSSTSSGSAAMMTSGPMAGAMMVAGGLLMAL